MSEIDPQETSDQPAAGSAVVLMVDAGRGDPRRYNFRPQGTKENQAPDISTGMSGEASPLLSEKVKLDYKRTQSGYTLVAMVPLEAIGLDPAATQMNLEILFSTTARPGDSYRLGRLADAASPFDNPTGFCRVNVRR